MRVADGHHDGVIRNRICDRPQLDAGPDCLNYLATAHVQGGVTDLRPGQLANRDGDRLPGGGEQDVTDTEGTGGDRSSAMPWIKRIRGSGSVLILGLLPGRPEPRQPGRCGHWWSRVRMLGKA